MIERLKQRYGQEAQQETFRTQLRCRKQQERESLGNLLHDIRRLVSLAFPGPTNITTEIVAQDSFLDAMRDKELALKIREREPRSLDETYRIALRLESYKYATEIDRNNGRKFSEVNKQVRSTCEEDRIEQLNQRMSEFFANQVKWQHDLEKRLLMNKDKISTKNTVDWTRNNDTGTHHESVRFNNSRFSANANKNQPRRCFKCQGYGHLARDCRNSGRAESPEVSLTNNISTSTQQKNKKGAVYITCVTEGQVHHCLVDTGSDENLIPARLVQHRKLYPCSKRLLAANGSEMKVEGQIVMDVQIKPNHNQEVTFLVSDEVQEIMLGMDFLIANECQVDFETGKVQLGPERVTSEYQDRPSRCRSIRVTKVATAISGKDNAKTESGVQSMLSGYTKSWIIWSVLMCIMVVLIITGVGMETSSGDQKECPICSQRFARTCSKFHVLRHLKNLHGISDWSEVNPVKKPAEGPLAVTKKGPNLKTTPMKRNVHAVKLACKGAAEPKSLAKLYTSASEAKNVPTPSSSTAILVPKKTVKGKEPRSVKTTADGPRVKSKPVIFAGNKGVNPKGKENPGFSSMMFLMEGKKDKQKKSDSVDWAIVGKEIRNLVKISRTLSQVKSLKELQEIGQLECPDVSPILINQVVAGFYDSEDGEIKENKEESVQMESLTDDEKNELGLP